MQYSDSQGRVTDAQLWKKTLSLEEMTSITNCTSFPEGNLLDWNSKNWILNSSRATAIEENLDLQDEVCPSLFFVTLYLVVPPSLPPSCFPSACRCVATKISPSCRCFSKEGVRRSMFAGSTLRRNPQFSPICPNKQTIGCNQEDLCQDCILH